MSRTDRLLDCFFAANIDALLIGSMQNIRYLTGFASQESGVAVALVSSKSKLLITDYRFAEQAHEQCDQFEVFVRDRSAQTLGQVINQVLTEHKLERLGFEADHFVYQTINEISADIVNASCLPVTRLVEQLRYCKDNSEIAAIRKAAAIGDKALHKLLEVLRVGISERDAAIELEYQLFKAGAQGLAFPTIFTSGHRTSYPHGYPTDRRLREGDLVGVDFGAMVDGYRSDMTRTFVIGKADEKQQEVYQLVLDAQQLGIDSTRAGIPGSEPAKAVHDLLMRSDYAHYVQDGLGHGVGLDLHEWPFMATRCDNMLEQNSVVTIEPGIYIPGWGGVRIEDDVLVTCDGVEVLTHFPKHLIEIPC